MSSPFPVPDAFAHVAPSVPGVRLGEPLGQGGFATVYAGEQVSLRRPVAVKIDSRPLHDERNRRRFMREMAAASRISGHPNAVSLIDSGVLPDGRPYLVMERCDGGSLAQVLERCELSAAQASASSRPSPPRWEPLTKPGSSTAISSPETSSLTPTEARV